MKVKWLLLFLTIFPILTSCQTSSVEAPSLTEEAPIQELHDTIHEISIETQETNYATNAESILLEIKNNSKEVFISSTHFYLEKKEGDTWYEFPYNFDAHHSDSLELPPNKSTALELPVKDLKYDLSPGEYRAVLNGMAFPFYIK